MCTTFIHNFLFSLLPRTPHTRTFFAGYVDAVSWLVCCRMCCYIMYLMVLKLAFYPPSRIYRIHGEFFNFNKCHKKNNLKLMTALFVNQFTRGIQFRIYFQFVQWVWEVHEVKTTLKIENFIGTTIVSCMLCAVISLIKFTVQFMYVNQKKKTYTTFRAVSDIWDHYVNLINYFRSTLSFNWILDDELRSSEEKKNKYEIWMSDLDGFN